MAAPFGALGRGDSCLEKMEACGDRWGGGCTFWSPWRGRQLLGEDVGLAAVDGALGEMASPLEALGGLAALGGGRHLLGDDGGLVAGVGAPGDVEAPIWRDGRVMVEERKGNFEESKREWWILGLEFFLL